MSWERAPVAAALAGILGNIDAQVKAFELPPETFNPPAFIVGYPQTVDYDVAAFGVDLVALPIAAFCGTAEVDRVDALLTAAKVALEADLTLGGAVKACKPRTQQAWRRLSVAGAEVLGADIVLEIRM